MVQDLLGRLLVEDHRDHLHLLLAPRTGESVLEENAPYQIRPRYPAAWGDVLDLAVFARWGWVLSRDDEPSQICTRRQDAMVTRLMAVRLGDQGHAHSLARFELIWADGAYNRVTLKSWLAALRKRRVLPNIRLQIVRRPPGTKGFVVLLRRWVVERTFGWLGRYRRMSKDYEVLTDTSESMIYVAMIDLMSRRLAAI